MNVSVRARKCAYVCVRVSVRARACVSRARACECECHVCVYMCECEGVEGRPSLPTTEPSGSRDGLDQSSGSCPRSPYDGEGSGFGREKWFLFCPVLTVLPSVSPSSRVPRLVLTHPLSNFRSRPLFLVFLSSLSGSDSDGPPTPSRPLLPSGWRVERSTPYPLLLAFASRESPKISSVHLLPELPTTGAQSPQTSLSLSLPTVLPSPPVSVSPWSTPLPVGQDLRRHLEATHGGRGRTRLGTRLPGRPSGSGLSELWVRLYLRSCPVDSGLSSVLLPSPCPQNPVLRLRPRFFRRNLSVDPTLRFLLTLNPLF